MKISRTSPSEWKQKKLIEVADLQTGIAKNSKRTDGAIQLPYLRVANVQDGALDLRDIQKIEIPQKKAERYRLHKNDLLLVEGNGNPENLGRCAIWDGSIKDCIHQNHLFVVRAIDSKIDYRYLALQIMSERGRDYLLSCSKSSSGLATLNSTQLKGFPAIVPPLPEQKAIADLLSTWDEAIEKTERLIQAKEERFKRLLNDLIYVPTKEGNFLPCYSVSSVVQKCASIGVHSWANTFLVFRG
ncbi:MAG: restriction endonuclease subunit S [Thermodesulfobacteriota bacterium]|nr:restriction endonuclease subunit S [Thermodesulfobacteriota bacterium]